MKARLAAVIRTALSISLLAGASAAAKAAEYIRSETLAPTSVRELDSAVDLALTPDLDEVTDEPPATESDTRDWVRESSIFVRPRGYYFRRENRDDSINEATAIGGEVGYTSGQIGGIARLGLSYYGSFGLDADEDRGGTGLLARDQSDLSVLGKAYLQFGETGSLEARLYRQTLSLPFLNKDDSRMIPNTHEAYVLGKQGDRLGYALGYVTKIKLKDSEDFIPVSQAAGALESDKGLAVAALKMGLGPDTGFGVFNMYGSDTFNTAYLEGKWISPLPLPADLKVSAQYTDQRSTGDALVGEIDTRSMGVSVSGSRYGVIATAAFTSTDEGGRIRSPWGGTPVYNSMMLENFSRAGEESFRFGLSVAGSETVRGTWSGFINVTTGWDAIEPDTGDALPDVTEYDLTVDFKPETANIRNLWVRLRGAYADFEDDSRRWNARLIVNYSLRAW